MPKRLTNIETINKLNSLGLKYDFSKFQYNGDRLNKSVVICPVHGEFEISFHNIIKSHKGLICKKCRYEYKQKIMLEKYHGDNYIPELKIPQRDRYRTKEDCKQEALKYSTKKDFKANNRNVYEFATNHKFLDEICSHMIKFKRIKYYKAKFMCYWTKKRCAKIALKYITRSTFAVGAKGAYKKASKYKWLDEICMHMTRQGDRKHKCIYSYEFPDNHVYVGLTYNINKRQNHRNKDITDQVTKYIFNTSLIPLRKQLTEYLPVEQAIILESNYVDKYKNEGWILLNKSKTGGIGGSERKWTFNKCKEIALKCQTKTEFIKVSNGAYSAACRNKWLDEICMHMIKFSKPRSHWTLETCIDDIKKYSTKNEWRKNSPTAYRFACKNNYLKQCYLHISKFDKSFIPVPVRVPLCT